MGKRESLSRDYSEEMFSRNAAYVHPKNRLRGSLGPMRGGIRL